MNSSSHF